MPSRIRLPGFGLPLNYVPGEDDTLTLFPNALHDSQTIKSGTMEITTLREFTMLNIMNTITDKPNWHVKVFDDQIAQKWKEEMLASGADVTQPMADWCIDELRYKAEIFEKTAAVSVFNGDVVKSDTVIPEALKKALKAAVAPLERVPARLQDWHPNSDNKVLDLVHPSLYPLIYGRSRVLPDTTIGLDDCIEESGNGDIIPVPPKEEAERYAKNVYSSPGRAEPFSRQFQWLPCDVSLSDSDNGHSVKIVSYINNLHPGKNKDLYTIIEKIIEHTIPLWNLTLTPLKNYDGPTWVRVAFTECHYDPDPENGPETDGPQQEEDEDDDDYSERREQWYRDTRKIVLPEPGPFKPPGFVGEDWLEEDWRRRVYEEGTKHLKPAYSVDMFRDYSQKGLQIIVKLANIHLTPEKPTYDGGTWHVEGQLNEHICASAIYYYDNDNITSSKLAFRQRCSTDIEVEYEQDHHDWLNEVFGCEQHGSTVQNIGAIETPEGRLLTWPNILQHQVQPFELADRTKPGHRKILAFFLVDPNIRIISTANVPCQQRDWWAEAVTAKRSALSDLPVEIREHIVQDVADFPITLEEAKEARLKLMEERGIFVEEHDREFNSDEFSLCEH